MLFGEDLEVRGFLSDLLEELGRVPLKHISQGGVAEVGRGEFTQFGELAEIKCTFYLLYAGDGFNDIMYVHSFNLQSNAEGDIQLLSPFYN